MCRSGEQFSALSILLSHLRPTNPVSGTSSVMSVTKAIRWRTSSSDTLVPVIVSLIILVSPTPFDRLCPLMAAIDRFLCRRRRILDGCRSPILDSRSSWPPFVMAANHARWGGHHHVSIPHRASCRPPGSIRIERVHKSKTPRAVAWPRRKSIAAFVSRREGRYRVDAPSPHYMRERATWSGRVLRSEYLWAWRART